MIGLRGDEMSVDLHDYSIVGLEICNKNGLVIKFANPLGTEFFELVLTGIQRLYVDGFSVQNIVLDLNVFYEKAESFDFKRACTLLEIDPEAPREISGSGCVMFIEASSGAEVACLMDHPWEPLLTRIEMS